jgi:predicted metal-binding membrane protein
MDAGPGTDLGTLGWFAGSWILMMTAMMLPSFVPTLTAYATFSRGADRGSGLIFAAGYLLVWAAVGIAAYGIFELGKALLGSELAWHDGGRWFSAGVVAGAAAYEFIPLKQTCLSRCRGQFGNVRSLEAQRWPDALATGARSGFWCLGSSWALMAALFALGAMSLTWMLLVSVLIAAERLLPRAARIGVALVLVTLAAAVALVPGDVPALTIPTSRSDMPM